jgi:hypothetical protein
MIVTAALTELGVVLLPLCHDVRMDDASTEREDAHTWLYD